MALPPPAFLVAFASSLAGKGLSRLAAVSPALWTSFPLTRGLRVVRCDQAHQRTGRVPVDRERRLLQFTQHRDRHARQDTVS